MQPGAGGVGAGGAPPQPASTTRATAAVAATRRTDGTIDYSPEQFFRCRGIVARASWITPDRAVPAARPGCSGRAAPFALRVLDHAPRLDRTARRRRADTR